MKYATTVDDKTFLVEINDDRHVTIDGKTYEVDFESVAGQAVYSLILNGRSWEGFVHLGEADEWQVLLHGDLYRITVEDERERRLRARAGPPAAVGAEYTLKAPMPGLVVSILVSEGQSIRTGDVLIVLESMKMQNELKSPRDGSVLRLRVNPGDSVNQNQPLVTIG